MKLNDQNVYALYNVDKGEIIGIFKIDPLVKFVFGRHRKFGACHVGIRDCAIGKRKAMKITTTQFSFKSTVRFAKEEYVKLLGERDYLILNTEYNKYLESIANTFSKYSRDLNAQASVATVS